MQVILFKVLSSDGSQALEERIQQIVDTPLEERVRNVGYQIRLEAFQKPTDEVPYWQLDFAKLRFDGGPGRASVRTQTTSFDLNEGEVFSEEAALLYDPATKFAVLQYNHHGPRWQAISDYLSVFDPNVVASYEFRVKLRDDAQARYIEWQMEVCQLLPDPSVATHPLSSYGHATANPEAWHRASPE